MENLAISQIESWLMNKDETSSLKKKYFIYESMRIEDFAKNILLTVKSHGIVDNIQIHVCLKLNHLSDAALMLLLIAACLCLIQVCSWPASPVLGVG